MDRPIRLCAALPFYAIGGLIIIGSVLFGILGEIKSFMLLIDGLILNAAVNALLYPIGTAILIGIGSLVFALGGAIHGEPKPAPVVPAWETYL